MGVRAGVVVCVTSFLLGSSRLASPLSANFSPLKAPFLLIGSPTP